MADVNSDADRRVAELLHERVPPTRPCSCGASSRSSTTCPAAPGDAATSTTCPSAWLGPRTRRAASSWPISERPPAAVVVEHRDVFPAVTGDAIDSAAMLRGFPRSSSLLHERYRLETTIEDFDVYLAAR